MNILSIILHPTFVLILGIITYALFLWTLIGGLLRKQLAPKMKRSYIKMHRTCGILAVIFATVHVVLMIAF
ncbi:hypothetical protein GF359_03945 [candidate division WOR-3 bacterium]|uniref:Uncharacterized protein n=1 Tax=candidate division WOR-3 bacterium TaxID=2052148 RepID=A0A9D5QCA7_UNCW3|nr:hypothetical protein [candidate division WOR-3 bacterium]MBD3364349.1 hypothetical protein [candidate division WOR-3 bacterium]